MRERRDIRFTSQGRNCTGWFYPVAGKEASPCIILAHGFGGTKEMRLDAYAESFADAGYHALVFDYRHFGESEGEPRQILDIKKQHQDWHAAVRFARGLPGVDPCRLILWGTSFSGGHVIPVAINESGIAAVISQVPHLDGMATAVASGPTQNFRLGMAAWRDLIRMALRRSPYYVPIVGKPGEPAAMTAPDADEGVKKLYPENFVPNELVAARIFLKVGLYSPGRLASRLTVPWLVQAASEDLTTPVKPAIKAVMRAPRSQLIIYRCGHFEVYVPPRFGQTVEDQITFLRHCLK
ncbi:MAG TPA: alpha/beta hydrolase [Desulfomonilia bacterium]|nr:alpha/beta hydrolase [Desulfomonilia bacterium]